jgi:hypothetical protein
MYARYTGQCIVIFALLGSFIGSVLSLPKHARDPRRHLISRSNKSESLSARDHQGHHSMAKRADTVLFTSTGEA